MKFVARVAGQWRVGIAIFVIVFALGEILVVAGGATGAADQSFLVRNGPSAIAPLGYPDSAIKTATNYANLLSEADTAVLVGANGSGVVISATAVGGSSVLRVSVQGPSERVATEVASNLRNSLLSASPPAGVLADTLIPIGKVDGRTEGFMPFTARTLIALGLFSAVLGLLSMVLWEPRMRRVESVRDLKAAVRGRVRVLGDVGDLDMVVLDKSEALAAVACKGVSGDQQASIHQRLLDGGLSDRISVVPYLSLAQMARQSPEDNRPLCIFIPQGIRNSQVEELLTHDVLLPGNDLSNWYFVLFVPITMSRS